MGLDIRLPIGLMFSVFGVLLVGFGIFGGKAIYDKSLGINVNLEWGIALLVFGLFMLLLGSRKPAAQPSTSASAATPRQKSLQH